MSKCEAKIMSKKDYKNNIKKVKSLSRVRLFATSLCSPPGSSDSFEKTLMLGRIEGGRRRRRQRMRWLDGITASMNMSLNKTPGVGDGQGRLECCSPWGCKKLDKTKRLNWTELRLLGPWGLSRILKWVAISFSRGFSQPMDRTWVLSTPRRLYRLSHQGSPQY